MKNTKVLIKGKIRTFVNVISYNFLNAWTTESINNKKVTFKEEFFRFMVKLCDKIENLLK